jgi:hypothetical protein
VTPAAIAARHVCLAAQPRSVHGSPDTLVVRGVEATLVVTEKLAGAIVRAVSGKSNAKAIEAAIKSAAKGFGTSKLAAPIERELLHGAMLGAADSWFETETGSPVKVETFATLHGSTGKLLEDLHRMVLSDRTFLASDTGFAGRPLKEAINAFLKKKAVTRDAFDAMEKEAQRRAFTVAGMANDAMVSTVKRELIRQVAVGADLREFGKHAAKRFEAAGWVPANPSHVETVFRTNVLGAYNGGRVRQMAQPEVLAVRPYWQSLPVGDGPPRQRPTHRMFVLLASDPFWQDASPPYGYNCLLPWVPVAGPVIGAARSFYRGQAFELATANGRRLAVTANHPVLTARGMVAAKLVREGDQLLRYLGQARVSLLRLGAQWHEHDAPLTADQVFRSLAEAEPVERAQVRADDFHGEAERFVGEIDVVGSYRKLLHDRQAAGTQQPGELALESTNALRAVHGPGASVSASRLDATVRAFHGAPGAAALPLDAGAIRLEAPPLDQLGGASTADLYALLGEHALHNLPADAEIVRQLLDRGAGVVAGDEVVGVREFYFAGHVFDFEAASAAGGGLILADDVLVGNCRCRVRSLSVRQGAPMVQSGGSIHGLPDPGFTSGLGALFEGPLPTGLPANDPSPAPAND